jgi:type IX secretion system PorP/SprF family membrane protein
MKITLPISTLFALALTLNATAQDPQFIQFYNAPMQLNPAMTGVHPGKWRVVANYREQWNSILDTRPFRTMSASFDARTRIGKGDYFAYGVTALRDQAGKSAYLRQTGDFSVSYLKQLDGSRYRSYDQYLIGGAQVGLGQHTMDYQNLWFSSQFNTITEQVDETINSGEIISDKSGVYMNINAGLMWYAVMDDNQSLYFGGSLHHVNAPKVSFIAADGEESMDMKWVVHAGGELPFNHYFSILPAAAVIGQGPSLFSLFGANFRYTNRDWKELAIRAGAWGHLVKDVNKSIALPAVTFTAILEMERWNIGVSYDVNTNQLAPPTNSRGAFELSLIYYHPATRREKVNCPKM